MKNKFIYFFIFFIIGIFLSTVFIFGSYFFIEDKLIEETTERLSDDSESKARKVQNYLLDLEKNIEELSESEEIKYLLKQDLVFDEDALKEDVDNRAGVITREIGNYIRFYPDMTLEDLQKSSELQEIAVRPVGKEGYSAIFEVENLITYFHKDPNMIDFDLDNLEKSNPGFFEIISRIREGEEIVNDFYDWKESSGEIRKKYGSYRRVSVKTGDGKTLAVATTAYLDDYKVISTESEFLKNFNKEKDYHNLILISPEGYLSYMTSDHEGLGTNLEWKVNLDKGLSINYFDVKENKKILFYGPFIEEYGHIFPFISVMAPVYDNKDLLGYVGILDEMDKVFGIIKDSKNLGETGQSYLVNNERLLISPLRNQEFDIMVQPVFTENIDECIEDLEEKGEKAFEEESEEHEEGDIRISENYKGNLIIGTDYPFPNLEWCLLVEIDKSEAVDIPLESSIKKMIYLSLLIVLVLTLIGFFIGRYFDRRSKKKKIKKVKSKEIKKIVFLENLKLRYWLLFAFLFCVGYFFLITSFFQGWQNAKLFDDIPDLLIAMVAFVIIACSFKLKDFKPKKFIFLGGLCILISRLIEIPLQEYQFMTFSWLPAYYWIPVQVSGFLGFLLILLGFKEAIKW